MTNRQLGKGMRAARCAALLGVLSFLSLLSFLSFSSFAAAAPAPFALPISAKAEEGDAKTGGWKASGTIAVSYRQARAQFAVKVAAAGWAHMHTINLGKDRTVEAWQRGGEELTLMIWSLGPGKSGFSYGVSKKAASTGMVNQAKRRVKTK